MSIFISIFKCLVQAFTVTTSYILATSFFRYSISQFIQTRIRRNHSLRHINSRNYLSIPSTNLRMAFSSRHSRLDSNKQAIAATSNVTSRHRNEARVRLSYISRNVGWLTTSTMGTALRAATDSFNASQRQMKRKTKREDRRDFNQRGEIESIKTETEVSGELIYTG